MPELIEVAFYRGAAALTVGHRITEVPVIDDLMVLGVDPHTLRDALVGRRITGARRLGKLLMLDLHDGPVLGLRFGMTGRLMVGGHNPVGPLEYGAQTDQPQWDRFVVELDGLGVMRLNDPRRLGRVLLDPDTAALGPEATTISTTQLRTALAGSHTALKARLLDQRRIAGLGNLLVDETLWRARLAPGRAAGSLSGDEERATWPVRSVPPSRC